VSGKGYKRKRLVIAGFQYRLMLFQLAQFITVALVVLGALYVPLLMKLDRSNLTELQKIEVSNQLMGLHQLLPTLWIVFGLIVILSIIVSNRVAGPIYQIQTILKAVSTGNLTRRLTLRKHDYMTEDATIVNAMIDRLHTTLSDMRSHQRAADAALTGVMSSGNLPGDARTDMDTLRAELDALKSLLDHFELRQDSDGSEPIARPDHEPVGV